MADEKSDSSGMRVTVHFKEKITEEQLRNFRQILESSGLELMLNETEATDAISGWLRDSSLMQFSQALLHDDLRDLLTGLSNEGNSEELG